MYMYMYMYVCEVVGNLQRALEYNFISAEGHTPSDTGHINGLNPGVTVDRVLSIDQLVSTYQKTFDGQRILHWTFMMEFRPGWRIVYVTFTDDNSPFPDCPHSDDHTKRCTDKN